MLFDTGLLAHLLGISSRESLLLHPNLGLIFETKIRLEINAILSSRLIPATLYHWRTKDGYEVDIILEYDAKFYAFECKWNFKLQKETFRGLRKFKQLFPKSCVYTGVIIPYGHYQELEEGIFILPWFQK